MRRVALLLALVTLIDGCRSVEPRWAMFPAPIVMQDPRLDFTRFVAPENHTTVMEVLFATARAPAPPNATERYLGRPGDLIRLGVARVQLGEPGWSFTDLVESDRTSTVETPRPAGVTSVEEYGAMGGPADETFIAAINRRVDASRRGQAVIYIPGYRVTFDEVMALMGGWAHYLGGSAAVVAFSWPSGTWAWDYFLDCRKARAYIPDIERLVALISEQSRARQLNLVAFSCGSSLLAEALVRLRARHPEEDHAALQQRHRIGNVIFVAADLDLVTFARSHVPAISDLAVRTQVYVSADDWALKFSALFAGTSRVGRPRRDELTRADLETLESNERFVGIDVTDVEGAHELDGKRGHGYWMANQRVSTDVLLSMIYPFTPKQRGLTHKPGRSMWTFPDDYPRRVSDAVYEERPDLRRSGSTEPRP